MKRREFIILTGVGATGAGLLSACGHPENRLIPALIPDEQYVPGVDYWKATACAMCDAGCGVAVRTREHKASKIEGNPHHPINRGALCARGQAGLQLLYNPDRIRGPMRRTGERGSASFEEISWDDAIKTLAAKLREIKAQPLDDQNKGSNPADGIVLLSGDLLSVSDLAAEQFMTACGSTSYLRLNYDRDHWVSASEGEEGLPIYDIANASYLLCFGARFLETWHSPVMYSLAYGEFRRSSGRARGRFVHVEPRMSLTAANADEWLPAPAGSEHLLALAMAQVIAREGLARNQISHDADGKPLHIYAPENVAAQTDTPAEKIVRLAREFAAAPRPLAIGSGIETIKAVDLLNDVVGNANKPGGVMRTTTRYVDPFETLRPERRIYWRPMFENLITGTRVRALLVHNANPVYVAPASLGKLLDVPFICSFSSSMDDTTALADLILPDHTYLESWDLRATHAGVDDVAFTLTRPVVEPELNTRQTADVLIALASELADKSALTISFQSAEQAVRRAAAELQKTHGSIAAETAEDFWKIFTERGVWVGKPKQQRRSNEESVPEPAFWLTTSVFAEQRLSESIDAKPEDYAYTLIAYEHAALGFGDWANLPWLQELPDPMTSVMWGSWVEINPKTADSLGVKDGDTVEVATPHGSLRAPAVIYPAIRPDTIAMPYGRGHKGFGRYASNRGANAALLDPFTLRPGPFPNTVRANVTKVAGESVLARFGTTLPRHAETER
ncbi:MAG TPA: molybdopterin-dependent oxidoreductase [Blastocatellia bacterium]|nr:molybdopterin-dependent oxidoreductase [Blastocatellia bacterium]